MADDGDRRASGSGGSGGAGRAQSDPLLGFMAQLRGVTDQLAGIAKLAEALPGAGLVPEAFRAVPNLPLLPNLPQLPPTPGALSAAQLKAISASVAAQRASIRAMSEQLQAFDQQLGVLERILGPLTEWSATWADLERRLSGLRPGGWPAAPQDTGAAADPATGAQARPPSGPDSPPAEPGDPP